MSFFFNILSSIGGYFYSSTPPRIYNWRRGKNLDIHKFVSFKTTAYSTKVDLTKSMKFPAVYDQQTIGSCTSNAICTAYQFDLLNHLTMSKDFNKSMDTFSPSRLYLYYKERSNYNNQVQDNGACIYTGINILQTEGVCSEEKWPYDVSKVNECPPKECDDDAYIHRSIEHRRVSQNLTSIKNCIENHFPVVFGMDVFESFEQLSTDNQFIVSFPQKDEKKLGGHAVIIVGFDDQTKLFKVRNSWGENWGDCGHFYIPYEYVLDESLCADFWVLSLIRNFEEISKKRLWSQIGV